jgi:hypothetical protein
LYHQQYCKIDNSSSIEWGTNPAINPLRFALFTKMANISAIILNKTGQWVTLTQSFLSFKRVSNLVIDFDPHLTLLRYGFNPLAPSLAKSFHSKAYLTNDLDMPLSSSLTNFSFLLQ